MKWTMEHTLCIMSLNKIIEIKYRYGILNQPMGNKILWRVTILFIYKMGVIHIKRNMTRRKNSSQMTQ